MREASWVERKTSLNNWGLRGSKLAAVEIGAKPFLLMGVSP